MNHRSHPHRPLLAVTALSVALALAACSDDTSSGSGGSGTTGDRSTSTTDTRSGPHAKPVIDPGDGGDYQPTLSAADVVPVVDNPYLPFLPGAHWAYEGTTDEGTETTEVRVQPEKREVDGMQATVVRDTVRLDGELIEDTYDWYVQDTEGNVWYVGEDVTNYENGKAADKDGSWEAGVDGALPGIVMPAHPKVGDAYRQEYWKGEAEDLGQILEVGGTRGVRAGAFTDTVRTRDWNPLEPEVIEEKTYAPGVGVIFEEAVEGAEDMSQLVSFTSGSAG